MTAHPHGLTQQRFGLVPKKFVVAPGKFGSYSHNVPSYIVGDFQVTETHLNDQDNSKDGNSALEPTVHFTCSACVVLHQAACNALIGCSEWAVHVSWQCISVQLMKF